MDMLIPLLYDIFAVAVLALCVAHCAANGFARTLFGLLGYILAAAFAIYLSGFIAEITYNSLFHERVSELVSDKISVGETGSELLAQIDAALSSLPLPIQNMLGSIHELPEKIDEAVAQGSETAAVMIMENILTPLITWLLRTILFLLIFGLSVFIIKRTAGIMKLINKVPLIGPINRLLGGVLGVAQGLVVLAVITLVISLVILLSNNNLQYLNREIISQTSIMKQVFEYNPLILTE